MTLFCPSWCWYVQNCAEARSTSICVKFNGLAVVRETWSWRWSKAFFQHVECHLLFLTLCPPTWLTWSLLCVPLPFLFLAFGGTVHLSYLTSYARGMLMMYIPVVNSYLLLVIWECCWIKCQLSCKCLWQHSVEDGMNDKICRYCLGFIWSLFHHCKYLSNPHLSQQPSLFPISPVLFPILVWCTPTLGVICNLQEKQTPSSALKSYTEWTNVFSGLTVRLVLCRRGVCHSVSVTDECHQIDDKQLLVQTHDVSLWVVLPIWAKPSLPPHAMFLVWSKYSECVHHCVTLSKRKCNSSSAKAMSHQSSSTVTVMGNFPNVKKRKSIFKLKNAFNLSNQSCKFFINDPFQLKLTSHSGQSQHQHVFA